MTEDCYKILIVEDNPTDRQLLKKILIGIRKGFDIRDVGSTKAAREEIDREVPDLILLDIYLPEQNGLEFLKQLQEKYEEIPVLVISAFSNEDDKFKGFELGATDFINKPLVVEDVKARVSVQLRIKRLIDDQKWASQKTNDGIRLLYKQLERKNNQLKQLDQMKDDLINNVSHELRTPLTIIRESINQVLEGLCGEINEKQSQWLNKSLTNIDRLRRIIDDLLDIATIEQGKLRLYKEPINMVDLVQEVSSNFASQVQKKGLSIDCIAPPHQVLIFADKGKMFQALTNLVGNAYKFTDEGRIGIILSEDQTTVVCRVKDTGPGVHAKDMPRLFSKFEQINRTHGHGPKGTGLGLAITKGIIESSGGLITVESQVGVGCEFIMTFPKLTIHEDQSSLLFCLKEYQKMYSTYSVLMFGIRTNGIESKGLLDILETFIKKQLYRQLDHTLIDQGAIYVILPNTEKHNANIVLERIHQMIKESMKQGGESFKTIYSYAVTCPQDGLTTEELITKLETYKKAHPEEGIV